MDAADFGMRVRVIRKNKGWTQAELARRLGISASFLAHVERGVRPASLELLVEMCRVLEVSPDFLLAASLQAPQEPLPDAVPLSAWLDMAREAVRREGLP